MTSRSWRANLCEISNQFNVQPAIHNKFIAYLLILSETARLLKFLSRLHQTTRVNSFSQSENFGMVFVVRIKKRVATNAIVSFYALVIIKQTNLSNGRLANCQPKSEPMKSIADSVVAHCKKTCLDFKLFKLTYKTHFHL